jgi:hypothetical protein
VVQALGARALLEIVGKRVLVARVHGGIEAQLLVAGPADLPALVTVSEDAAPGTVVTTGRGSPPSSRPEPSSLEGAGSRE